MSYKLKFKSKALKEWKKLGDPVREQFKKRLRERLETPRVESARLSGLKDCYKIKLAAAGYRLVYEVRDRELIIIVVVVGKRERNHVYKIAEKRI
jgi:mRNA interferase RelE/StbE